MPCRDELFCAPSCGRAWPRLPDSYDCSNKDCCTNGSRSWKAENQGHAAPHADHAGHRKTNSFAVAGVRQNWRWHPRITDVRFWGKADMARCPLFPRKQTFAIMIRMSALCQKQTLRTILDASETIIVFNSTAQREMPKSECSFREVRKGCFTVPFHRARMETQGRYSCWDTLVGNY